MIMNKKILNAKNKFKDLSIIFTDDFMPPKPHKFTAKALKSGFNLDIFSLNNILSYYDIIILMVSNYWKIDLQWVTILVNNLTLVGPILLIKGPALGKFLLILLRFIRIKILNYINRELAPWNKIKSMVIRLLKPKFTLLIIDCINYGIYIGIKNFIANTYKDIILFNNININDLNIFLFCWGIIFMLSGKDCLVLLGHILLNFSTVISLWALTFYFMSNKEIKNFSYSPPGNHEWQKLGELFLLSLLFIGLFILFKEIFLFLILVNLKWKNFQKKLWDNIEDYILKVSSKHDLRSTTKKGSSGSPGPKKPGGPNNDLLTDEPKKKKYRARRPAAEIQFDRELTGFYAERKEGETTPEFEARVKRKDYRDHHKGAALVNKARRDLYKNNEEYRKKVLEANKNGNKDKVKEQIRKTKWNRSNIEWKNKLRDNYVDAVLPDKSDPQYYTELSSLLKKNEGKRLSSIVSFGKKVKERNSTVVEKALIELRKDDPSIFNLKRPNTTMIDKAFLSKIAQKGEKN